MFFKDIPGLDDIKQKLIATVKDNHLAHALLFSGPDGNAALGMALAFAAYLNCDNPQNGDACGACPSCTKNQKYIHPDVHFVFPVCSTKNITGKDVVSASYLKDWRSFLLNNPYGSVSDWSEAFGGDNKQLNISKEESRHIIRNLSLKAFEGKYKVMLVWLPEYMHPFAANAILKVLEEPPEQTLFILVTHQAENLLTTILSRTQPFSIRAFTVDEIANELVASYGADEKKALHIAQVADGNLNEAVRMLNEVEDDSHKMFRDWMRLCYMQDFTQLVASAEQFQKLARLAQKSMLQYGLNVMRETLLTHAGADSLSRLNGEEKQFVVKFSGVINPAMIEAFTSQLDNAIYNLERNASPKIVFLDLSLTISGIMKSG